MHSHEATVNMCLCDVDHGPIRSAEHLFNNRRAALSGNRCQWPNNVLHASTTSTSTTSTGHKSSLTNLNQRLWTSLSKSCHLNTKWVHLLDFISALCTQRLNHAVHAQALLLSPTLDDSWNQPLCNPSAAATRFYWSLWMSAGVEATQHRLTLTRRGPSHPGGLHLSADMRKAE